MTRFWKNIIPANIELATQKQKPVSTSGSANYYNRREMIENDFDSEPVKV